MARQKPVDTISVRQLRKRAVAIGIYAMVAAFILYT